MTATAFVLSKLLRKRLLISTFAYGSFQAPLQLTAKGRGVFS